MVSVGLAVRVVVVVGVGVAVSVGLAVRVVVVVGVCVAVSVGLAVRVVVVVGSLMFMSIFRQIEFKNGFHVWLGLRLGMCFQR